MPDEVYQQYRIVDHHAFYFMSTVDAINRIFNALAFHILDGLTTPKPKTRGIKVVGYALMARKVLACSDGDLPVGGCFWLITKTGTQWQTK